MALEDFFTLTEMKDGLMAIDRVEELVCAMQKEKDAVVHNINETARQWSTVANTLVATENMSIHKHFIQLGGLLILDQWLQTAQQYNNNSCDSSLEESTCKLFKALEKLPVDHDTAAFSGIIVTVKNLIEHKSSRVQERAKALFDWLNRGTEKECNSLDVGKDGGCVDEVKLRAIVSVANSSLEGSAVIVSQPEVGAIEDRHVIEVPGNELQRPKSSDFAQSESVAIVEVPLPKVDEGDIMKRDAQDSSILSTPCEPNLDTVEESYTHLEGGANCAGTLCSPVTAESNGKPSRTDAILTGVDSNTSTVVSNPSDAAVGHSRSEANMKTADQKDGIHSNVSQDLSVTICVVRQSEDVNTHYPGKANQVTLDSATTGDISKPTMDTEASDEPVKSRLDKEVDSVDDNARQVEQEVVVYREALETRAVQPGSPDSVNGEQDEPIAAETQNGIPDEEGVTIAVISPKQEAECNHTESAHEKKTRGFDLNEMEQPSVVVAAKVFSVEGSSGRVDFLNIDLNKADDEPILAASPGFPSGESSVEVSSRTPKKLNLDLNHTVDDGYGYRSPSPVSSSSGIRNLDLNNKYEESHGCGASSSQVISLFGAQVSLPIKKQEPSTTPYLGRSQGYGGVYGSGSAPSGSGSATRSLFPLSMHNAPSGYNWAIPTPATGPIYIAEERGLPMQLFNNPGPGQANMLEESRSKRVEPENGFDPYSGVYRRQPPPAWQ